MGKKNTTAFLTLIPLAMMAELVVENGTAVGFGWNTIVDDVGVQRSGSAEETSEVWFGLSSRNNSRIQRIPAIRPISVRSYAVRISGLVLPSRHDSRIQLTV